MLVAKRQAPLGRGSLLFALAVFIHSSLVASASLRLYVGGSGAVTTLDFDTGALEFRQVAAAGAATFGTQPSWITFDRSGKVAYITNQVSNWNGKANGALFSAALKADGTVVPIDTVATFTTPTISALSRDGKSLGLTSGAGDGVAVYSVDPATHRIHPQPVMNITLQGSGPNKKRQSRAYPHSFNYDPTGAYAFVADLGSDLLRIFSVDAHTGNLTALAPVAFPAGSGPRHLAFYVDPRTRATSLYVVCELGNLVAHLAVDYAGPASRRPLARIAQVLSTLPAGTDGADYGASEVAVSPDGRYLYAANRHNVRGSGEALNTFAVYGREAGTGALALDGFYPTGGIATRHFAMDPTGEWVVSGAQWSDRVYMHRRNATSGALAQVASFPVAGPLVQLFAP